MRAVVKPDGSKYWEYVLLYVDDAICCSCSPKDVLTNEIGKFWKMKKRSIGPPNIYLGNKVSKVSLKMVLDAGLLALHNMFMKLLIVLKDTLK